MSFLSRNMRLAASLQPGRIIRSQLCKQSLASKIVFTHETPSRQYTSVQNARMLVIPSAPQLSFQKRYFAKKKKAKQEAANSNNATHEASDNLVSDEYESSETNFTASEEEEDPLPDPDQVKERMTNVISTLTKSFQSVRGSEPTPELFDAISVDVYGSKSPLSSVAQVLIQSPTRAILSCFDPSTAAAVRDAVRDSGMNFNPQLGDGGDVVVPIPKVSNETRVAIAKQLGGMAEKAKMRIRNIRRSAMEEVKLGKDGKLEGVSKDDAFRVGKEIDGVTEDMGKTLNEVLETKQAAIMQV
mmetsp:Transcript_14834/g.18039  ORF Transcript_14834/g.18039 Transcript_14834/m.18039 type:complete len:300 (-) Transcript_14834:163-1062(-)